MRQSVNVKDAQNATSQNSANAKDVQGAKPKLLNASVLNVKTVANLIVCVRDVLIATYLKLSANVASSVTNLSANVARSVTHLSANVASSVTNFSADAANSATK